MDPKKGPIFACYGLMSATLISHPCNGIYRSTGGGISWKLMILGFYSQTPASSFAMIKDEILKPGQLEAEFFIL